MSFGDVATRSGGTQGDGAGGPLADRLSLGVAARLSRYLQVLTQARKMGKETISSQELSEYTHVNSTQIRRDLSGLRQVRQARASATTSTRSSARSARSCGPPASTTSRCSAPATSARRSRRATSSPTTASASSRSSTPRRRRSARRSATRSVRHPDDLKQIVEEEDIVVGVLAVPTAAAQPLADQLVDAGVKIIFNYSEALLQVPPEVTVHTSQPRRRPPLRALLLPDLAPPMIDVAEARDLFDASTDGTVGIEEEFALLDHTLRLTPAFERLRDAGLEDSLLRDAIAGELISSEIEIRSGRGEDFEDARRRQHEARRRLFTLAAKHDVLLGATGTHPLSDYREQHIIDTPHYRPRGGGPEVRGVAQQHVQPARPRRHPGRRPGRPRLRPPAPGPAAAAGDQRQLALRRPHRLRPALRPHPDLHQVVPPLRGAGRHSGPGRRGPTTSRCWCAPTRSSSSPSCGGRCARTTASAPSRSACATPRQPGPRPTRSPS